MHIPDGYISPSTCAALYSAAAPFWYVALRKVRRLLRTRVVPLVAVVSAFSFVIMMFNVPVPGGTTSHAVGMGVAAVVLGPWASMLAISMALLIQALFFGDGGLLAFGANAFNMAIVGSLVAYWTYRLLAGKAEISSSRRVIAAVVAGYAANAVAGLLTAVELGIQPALFQDAAGAPLYGPYPLGIAIPAMMIAHLTLAAVAEGAVTGGVVAYLQRSQPSLLKLTAPAVADPEEGMSDVERKGGWRTTRSLWMGMAVLMILTPLGLLATGMAWGEWGAGDFAQPEARQEIAATSGNHPPPTEAPQGLERLSAIWTAPIPDYAPPFMQRETFGYVLSAVVGIGLLVLVFQLTGWLTEVARRGREV